MEEGIEITVSILRAGEDEIVPRIGMLGDLEGLLDMSGTSTTRVSGRVLVGGLGDWAGVQICLDRKKVGDPQCPELSCGCKGLDKCHTVGKCHSCHLGCHTLNDAS